MARAALDVSEGAAEGTKGLETKGLDRGHIAGKIKSASYTGAGDPMKLTISDYDPQTWTPDEFPEFTGTDVGKQLTPIFCRIRDLTSGPYDAPAHALAANILRQLVRTERLMTPEEEFVASRMACVARHRVELWATTRPRER